MKKETYHLPKMSVIPVGVMGMICMSSNDFTCPDWNKGTDNWFEDDDLYGEY